MKSLLFIILAVSFAEYSYQERVLNLGPVNASVEYGRLDEKHTPSDEEKVLTAEAWNKSGLLWESLVTKNDPMYVKEAIIQCGFYTLNLSDITISGRFADQLQELEVLVYPRIPPAQRIDARSFAPVLTIKANFVVTGPVRRSTDIFKGKMEALFTNVTHDLAVGSYLDTRNEHYVLSDEKSCYTIGNAKFILEVNWDVEDKVLKSFLNGHKQDILKYVTNSLRPQASEALNILLPVHHKS